MEVLIIRKILIRKPQMNTPLWMQLNLDQMVHNDWAIVLLPVTYLNPRNQ